MAMTDGRSTVVDAGPLIHLDELGCLDLLEGFGTLWVTDTVSGEVLTHRPEFDFELVEHLRRTRDPEQLTARLQTFVRTLDLNAGEVTALAVAETKNAGLFLSDDAAARLVAESLGYRVHGTIGIIVRSIRRGKRTAGQIRGILRELPNISTLHVSRNLLERIVTAIPES